MKYVITLLTLILFACSPVKDDDTVATATIPTDNGSTNSPSYSDNNTTYVVTASGGKFYLDSVQQKTLTFRRGYTYNFNSTNSSTDSHPLYIGTNSTGGGYSDEYTSGVTNSRTTNGTLVFVVPANAPNTLYYNCGAHSNMGAEITIVN